MLKALIFDMDGTLAQTEKLHYKAWEATLINNGVKEFTFQTFLGYIGTSNEQLGGDYIKSDAITKPLADIVLEKQKIYMDLIPQVELCTGALEIIERFHPHFTLAVASSSHEKEVRAILRHHNIEDKFAHVFCGDMVVNKKPDPEIYIKTQQALQVQPSECVAFEDTCPGVTAAKAAGLYAVAIPDELTKNHDFSTADRIVDDFHQIDDAFLKNLCI